MGLRRIPVLFAGAIVGAVLTAAAGCGPSGDDRGYWAHDLGHFKRAEGNKWVEQARDGIHQFEEVGRTPGRVELHDATRGVTVYLYADHVESKVGNTGNPRLYQGKWSTPPAGK